MLDERILTVDEVSNHLRVPVEVITQEINAGKMRAMNIGGHLRIRESELDAYKAKVFTGTAGANTAAVERQSGDFRLTPAADFRHIWPDGKDELFTNVQEGIASYAGKEYHVKLGFTVRHAAGSDRRRCLLLIDRYPTVEFVSAGVNGNGKMAAVIRDRRGKQIPVGGSIPPEYDALPVAPYQEVVVGPGASNGLAVVCEPNDFGTMIRHALIRTKFRGERP
jgi:excisionase family DNA binding protein